MLQEQRDKLEERILAYFDGALDKQSSKELLAEVQKSTESRALFKAHESLNQLISAARIPLETPIEAKRSIAERIPGLLAFIPGLLGGAQALPILSQSANPIWSFFAKIPLSTAISVGTSVAVLTTAGVIVKNKLDDNAAAEHKAKVAVVQNQEKRADGPQYSLATVPERDVAQPEVSHASAGVASSTAAGNEAALPKDGTNATHRSYMSHQTHKSFATSNAATPSHTGTLPTTNRANANQASIANALKLNEQQNPAIANPPAADNQLTDAAPISAVAPATSAVPQANIILPRTSVLSPLPMLFGEGSNIRPFASLGTRVSLYSVPGKQYPLDSHQTSNTLPVVSFTVGFDYLLNESFAIRLQGGQSSFAHEVLRGETQPGPGIIQNYVNYSTVETDPAFWSTAGASYQFNLTDAIPVILSAGAGAAWLHPIAFMADLGVSAEIPVSSSIALRPGVSFDALNTGIDGLRDGKPQPADAIVVHHELSGSGFWSTSLGLNLGIVVRY